MSLKGKTIIELTDVNTGEVEVHEDNNMITNAIYDFFNNNIEGGLFYLGGATADFRNNMIPLCPNGIGGILLFADPLEENAGKYYAPSANPCTGYASNDVNETTNVLRGSMNQTESMPIENGYKFVWDFATSQANGTISAVALTNKYGGVAYYGDAYDVNSKRWVIKTMSVSRTERKDLLEYINAVEVNFEENYFISIHMRPNYDIVIRKVKKAYIMMGLTDTLYEDVTPVMEEHVISPSVFRDTAETISSGYYDFFDGKDGYWYGFWHGNNSSGTANFKWIKISKMDFTFTEGTWAFENAQMRLVGQGHTSETEPYRYTHAAVMNGYLYVMAYSKTAVYKININNAADITKIELGFTSEYLYSSESYSRGTTYMVAIGDWIICSDFRISSDNVVYPTLQGKYLPFWYTCTPIFQYGPYLLGYGGYQYYSNYSVKRWLALNTPYLATINNLDSAVIKTADKTMKITYILTETGSSIA